MKITPAALLIGSAMTLAACAAVDDIPQEEGARERQVTPRSSDFRYYVVTRPDLEKCMYPLCGGVYVAEVNQATSSCFTGDATSSDEADCYAADIDVSILGLDSDWLAEVVNHARDGHVVLRGNLVAHSEQFPAVGKLMVEAAWMGQTLEAPTGHFAHVADAGIVCITYPCFSLTESTLNSDASQALSGVDFAASGASQELVDAAFAQLTTGGVIVAGSYQPTSGPAGNGTNLVASEFYMAVKNPAGEPCGQNVCGAGLTCCNASCGMCAPPGTACIQIACEPEPSCAHSECEVGAKLDATCSPCANTVCAADAYCCDTEWDALCSYEAAQWCGATCAAPPAACAHDVCKVGPKLDAQCSSCASQICAQDDYCCSVKWDLLCKKQATQLCGCP